MSFGAGGGSDVRKIDSSALIDDGKSVVVSTIHGVCYTEGTLRFHDDGNKGTDGHVQHEVVCAQGRVHRVGRFRSYNGMYVEFADGLTGSFDMGLG